MVGFIKGLFGAKQTAETESTPPPEAAPKQPKPRPQAFYLDSGDARTLGDLDYMKAAREIKRSFPKTLNGEVPRVNLIGVFYAAIAGAERTNDRAKKHSGRSDIIAAGNLCAADNTRQRLDSTKVDSVPKVKDPKERRRNDTNLDMFRTMARDIQKSNSRKGLMLESTRIQACWLV
jgi:hypothetical protein